MIKNYSEALQTALQVVEEITPESALLLNRIFVDESISFDKLMAGLNENLITNNQELLSFLNKIISQSYSGRN